VGCDGSGFIADTDTDGSSLLFNCEVCNPEDGDIHTLEGFIRHALAAQGIVER